MSSVNWGAGGMKNVLDLHDCSIYMKLKYFWTLKPKLLVILWSSIWWFGCLSECLSFCRRCWFFKSISSGVYPKTYIFFQIRQRTVLFICMRVIFCCMQKQNCSDHSFKIGVHRIVFGVPLASTAQQKPEEEKCPQIFVRRDVFRKWTKSNFQSIIYFELIWNVFKAQIQVSKVFRCAVCFNILPSFSQHPQMLQTQYWNGEIVCAENSSGNW